jgi:hypothetical protein
MNSQAQLRLTAIFAVVVCVACSDSDAGSEPSGDGGTQAGTGAGAGSAAGSSGAGTTAAGSGAGSGASGNSTGDTDAGTDDTTDAGGADDDNTVPKAGNPDGKCSEALPAEAKAVDTSTPTTVVGAGDAASCTHAALAAAIAEGGVITFDCGDEVTTIDVTATLELPVDRSTVIDGGNKIILDGGKSVRILHWNSPDWMKVTHTLTLQHLVLQNGKATGTDLIPTRPEPCAQGYNDGQGGAVLMRDGAFRAIDVTFRDNEAAELGPDTGGAGVYLLGSQPAYISGCSFLDNRSSNAGGIGALFATLFIYDSLFDGNSAVGHGANSNEPDKCSYINAGHNQTGSGGNGGAIYSDGVGTDITICGTQVRNNTAGAFGAAVFFTSNNASNKGTLSIRDSLMFNNLPENEFWEWKPGISTNADTPEPIDSEISR